MKYVVCKGNTVQHGIAKVVNKETVVELVKYVAGELIDLGASENERLLAAGIIRCVAEELQPEVEE